MTHLARDRHGVGVSGREGSRVYPGGRAAPAGQRRGVELPGYETVGEGGGGRPGGRRACRTCRATSSLWRSSLARRASSMRSACVASRARSASSALERWEIDRRLDRGLDRGREVRGERPAPATAPLSPTAQGTCRSPSPAGRKGGRENKGRWRVWALPGKVTTPPGPPTPTCSGRSVWVGKG